MSRFENRESLARFVVLPGVVLVATIILLALAEAGVRVRHYVKFGDFWGIESTYETDSATNLRVPIPNSETGSIKINSLGFRSPEIELPKPSDTVRIAFLGASTTFCAEVSSNAMTWPNLVVESIAKSGSEQRFDYVNAAVPGYSLSHSLQNLHHRVAPLDPDIIVIYHATNDLSFNSFQLALQQGVAEERGEKSMLWPSKYSLLWYLVEKNLMVKSRQMAADHPTQRLAFDRKEISRPFRRDLAELVEASKELADAVVLITFSTQLREEQTEARQKKAAVTSLFYMPYMTTTGLLSAFAAYNEVIREIAAEKNVELIEAAFAIPGDAEHFHDSVHFTDAGSKKMAEIVSHQLTQVATQIGS